MTTCKWFALCDHPAVGTVNHPALGAVPICARCAKRFDLTPEPLTTHEPRLVRHTSKTERNPLGKPLVIRVQGACTCGWSGVLYSLRASIEGWALAERDATEHAKFPGGVTFSEAAYREPEHPDRADNGPGSTLMGVQT